MSLLSMIPAVIKALLSICPRDSARGVADKAKWRMVFNFNGPDGLEYIFRVVGGGITPTGLRVTYPEFIDRLQRRANFRVMTPHGTRMAITVDDKKGLVNLINVSLGGAYGRHHQTQFYRLQTTPP